MPSREIKYFAETMQHKIDKNKRKECPRMNPDGKVRTWENCPIAWLILRCREELIELEEAIEEGDVENAILECADVGNFAMMVQDNLRSITGRKSH